MPGKRILAASSLLGIALSMTLGIGHTIPAHGQVMHPSRPLPSFEVASIRPSPPDERPGRMTGADRFVAKATTVKEMVMYAYGLGFDGELSGGPGWIGTDMFTIEATPDHAEADLLSKMSRDDGDEQMRLMMQSLLEQRFGLKVNFDKRKLPVYELVVAKGGLKCPKDSSPPAIANTARPRFGWSAAPAPPPPPPGYVAPPPDEARRLAQQPLHLRTKGWPFWLLVTMLSHQPELGGRMVIDKTGLDGSYDCEASWSRENSEGNGVSLFTAIQEQLGLKLVPSKASVETIVIDHIDRPSEN
jgi:uncharacterized protein (TIGR03435 family)